MLSWESSVDGDTAQESRSNMPRFAWRFQNLLILPWVQHAKALFTPLLQNINERNRDKDKKVTITL